MALLAINTAAITQLALQHNGTDFFASYDDARAQATNLVPQIQQLLAEAGCTFADLTKIAVVTGPGSFTGIRVGIATAEGLALALNVPAVGISAFEVWRQAAQVGAGKVLIMLDTQRDDCYSIGYEGGAVWLPPSVRDVPTLQTIIHSLQPRCVGDALPMVIAENKLQLNDVALGKALLACAAGATQPAAPYYLRAPDIGGQKTNAAELA